jgi:hypothetical protein
MNAKAAATVKQVKTAVNRRYPLAKKGGRKSISRKTEVEDVCEGEEHCIERNPTERLPASRCASKSPQMGGIFLQDVTKLMGV